MFYSLHSSQNPTLETFAHQATLVLFGLEIAQPDMGLTNEMVSH